MPAPSPPFDLDQLVVLHTAQALASSYRFNARNIEALWYGFWNHSFVEAVQGRSDYIVVPQLPLYYSEDDKGDEEERMAGENPDQEDNVEVKDDFDVLCNKEEADPVKPGGAKASIVKKTPPTGARTDTTSLAAHPRVEMCESDPNASTASAITIPLSDGYTCVPDFCLMHVCTVPSKVKNPIRFNALGGLQVTHACCAVIAEIKRAPRRKLTDPKQVADAYMDLLLEAIHGLQRGCHHYFEMFPRSESVIAIGASGPYWFCKLVRYTNTLRDGTEAERKSYNTFWMKSKIVALTIGTPASDAKWNWVKKRLAAKPQKPKLK